MAITGSPSVTGSIIALTYPQTISAWFNASSLSTAQVIAASARTSGWTTLGIRLETSGAVSAFLRDNGGAETVFTSTSLVSIGAWNHAAVVFTNSTSRKLYLNGSLEVSNTTSVSYTLLPSYFQIGGSGQGAYFYSGSSAEIANWNTSLNDSEVVSLSKGMKASRIRCDNLNTYLPLVRNLQEVMLAATVSTGSLIIPHPRVY